MVSDTRTKILLICVLFGMFYAAAMAARYGGRTAARGMNEGMYNRQDPRQQQQQIQQEKQARLREMITAAATNVDTILKEVLTRINDRQTPEAQLLTDAEAAMKESGAYMSRVEKDAQCQFFMLQSWVSYFQGDLPQATMASTKAYGLDEDNHDAYVTQAAMAFFADRTPIIKRPEPVRALQTNDRTMINDPYNRRRQPVVRQRPNEMMRNETVNVPTSSGNILQYDPDSIVTGLLGKSLPSMQMQCMDSSVIAYNAMGDTLCALIWQVGIEPAEVARPAEPNNVPPRINPTLTGSPRSVDSARPQTMTNRPSRDSYEDPRAGRGGASSGRGYYDEGMPPSRDMYSPSYGSTAAKPTLTSETEAFSGLFQEYSALPAVKFVGLNIDVPAARREVIQQIVIHPWPWAHVSATNPRSGATALMQLLDSPAIDKTRPILVVADGTGTIKYAGPATGFVAPTLLQQMVQNGVITNGTSVAQSSAPSNPLMQILQGIGGVQPSTPVQEANPTLTSNQITSSANQNLVGQRIGPLQLHGMNSTELAYQPGADTMCALVWQTGIRPAGSNEPNIVPPLTRMTPRTELARPAEANNVPPATTGRPSRPATTRRGETVRRTEPVRRPGPESYRNERERDMQRRDPRNPSGIDPDYAYDRNVNRGRESGRARTAVETRPTIESETAAFANLYAKYFDRPGIKFVAINTDDPSVRPQVLERILAHPWPWTQVMGKDPASGAMPLMQLLQSAQANFSEPSLLIVDAMGTVKYKGRASGDEAISILAQMEQSGLIPAQPISSNVIPTSANPLMQMIQGMGNSAAEPVTPLKPNPVSPPRRTGIPQTQVTDPDENYIDDHTLADAAKKLEFAKAFVSIGRKRYMTSKQGVDACREIIQKWPNTKYAEEARQLLRLVPENERKRYNITNEELGL
ncbi:MAG: hypothetical protein JXA82_05685 [Sedimentisphaerales bacterium]|nr:hypothetical protein [Sedimentisphaerales bacterium]